MKLRLFVMAAVLACLAATAVADLSSESIAWGQGPYQFLMTKEEAATWKTIQTDEAAKAFVDLFWARRDPTPTTPVNEYRLEIERRINEADQHLGAGEKVRGSMTDRGRTLLLYGTPKRMERSAEAKTPSFDMSGNLQRDQRDTANWVQWIYEEGDTKEIFGIPRATVRFVDRFGREEYKIERSTIDFNASRARAVAKTITQPDLKQAPAFTAAAPAPQPAEETAPVAVTELMTDALRSAVAELKAATKNPYENKAYLTWGEYVTSYGRTFVPVGLYVPKASGISGDVTFFGVVEDMTGKSVLAFEQPATLAASKDDFFVDKSLALPAGKHRGIFGLAQNGTVVALASTEMELAGNLDKDATAISQLILSNNIYPLTESQMADDPFAFGGVRVVPKADRTFRPSDELWYFFELRNPGLAEPALPEGTVPVNAAEVPRLPKVQVKLDVVGTTIEGKPVKMAAPPRESDAIEMKGVPGHYGVGNAIPLSSFKPGDYTFTVKVIDTIKKTSYTLTEKFKVVE
ncbi:MAG: GWxTD domain-containing protein [Thermoanaerobaculia bacterium]